MSDGSEKAVRLEFEKRQLAADDIPMSTEASARPTVITAPIRSSSPQPVDPNDSLPNDSME